MQKGHAFKFIFVSLFSLLFLSSCSTVSRPHRDGAPKGNVDVSKIPDAVPRVEPLCKYGNPRTYYVNGRKEHVLKSAKGYSKVGFASWYGTKFNGQLTSSREPYDLYGMTAASRELPIPTYVQVTNLENGKTVIVRVNDRGPFVGTRIMDLSYAAAKKLGYAERGTTLVRVTAIDPRTWSRAKQTNTLPPIEPIPYRFYLQVGAFANADNAERHRQSVMTLTHQRVIVVPGYANGKPIYRVQIGPLAAGAAEKVREQLAEEGIAVTNVMPNGHSNS